jgi:peptidyl-prolyl cis-trans isomerase SurA
MIGRSLRTPAAFFFGATLLGSLAAAQTPPAYLPNPYGGKVVEYIIARVNNRIITNSDYQRALNSLEQQAEESGQTPQDIAQARRNLLRTLIDQQLWLSKGKQLGIKGNTGMIKQLDRIRKEYHLATMDDLKQAARAQGVSFADFQANIRNQVIIQDVMRKEVGNTIQVSPLEARQYYEEHKQDYMRPESVHLSEILISAGKPGSNGYENPKLVAQAKLQAENIEAKLHAGGDFAELARTFSDGSTAADGGDLGTYQPGQLPPELQDKTFSLKTGQWTAPILTRQGWIILKVEQHTPAGPAPFDAVESKVEDALFMRRMQPALDAYLKKLRDQASIFIAPGYVDTGATQSELHPTITFSTYTPPAPKKRVRAERTRYRFTARPRPERAVKQKKTRKHHGILQPITEKPGKKEKIRFGQKPRETLPSASTDESSSPTVENAGALSGAAAAAAVPQNLYPAPPPPRHKWRYSQLAKERREKHMEQKKHEKRSGKRSAKLKGFFTAPPPSPGEAADRAVQSASLGMGTNASKKKNAKLASTGKKVRYSQMRKEHEAKKKKKKENKLGTFTPPPSVAGAPAPPQ